MSTPLSLYTTKILSEHPLAVWALDDKVDYVAILSDTDRDLSTWATESLNVTVEESSELSSPILGQSVYNITHSSSIANEVATIRFTSNPVGPLTGFDEDLATFSISTFLNSTTNGIMSATLGISYNDETYGTYDVPKKFTRFVADKWMMLSETFDIPQGINENYSVFLEIEYLVNSLADPETFFVSGYSVGQWAEEFTSTSIGVSPEFLSDSIYGIPSDSKGIRVLGSVESTKDGYVLSNDTRLYARNFGMPLVYGSESSTTIYPNSQLPSVLIPGLGMLNKSGQNKNYSLEFWMRINASTSEEKRILGPVASEDGIYVDGPFLKLKIGRNTGSHFVGEWSRPMIIHLVISEQNISLLVNGESVISLNVDRSTLNLPEEFISTDQADWIGIYSYDDVTPFEINSISIYSYLISPSIAKRRWIYGQAVDNPEALNTAYGGKSVYFDYEFAKYSNGYSYPKTGSWSDGINNNLQINEDRLMVPEYELPDIVSETQSSAQILESNFLAQDEASAFLSLPSQSHLYFNKLNQLNDRLESFFAVFRLVEPIVEEKALFLIRDITTGNSLCARIDSEKIYYSFEYMNIVETIAYTEYEYSTDKFAVGADLDLMSDYFGKNVSKFLSNRDSLELFVCGGPDEETFSGNIYQVSFLNKASNDKISDLFFSSGLTMDMDTVTSFLNTDLAFLDTQSYTLKPYIKEDYMYLDVAISGSWTSSMPMSYFGKYVKNNRGSDIYDLDFVQFNVGYPAPGRFVRITETDESWTYQELNLKFSSPVQKRYSDLDNGLYTGYVDYTDLQYNSRQSYRYDTSSALAKTYVYFKDISSGFANSSEYYSNIILPAKNGIVSPGDEWVNSKYEIVDDMIIYPPQGLDFKTTSMFVEIVIEVDGISDKPLAIDKLQFASISLNNSYGTPIGTKFGTDVYPYRKNGFYYDFKSKNPFSIYKGSTPYLYLNKNSGIRMRGDFSSHYSRGIEVPVNQEQSPKYKMIALQFFAKFDDDFFPYSPTEILEIESKSSHIKLFMEATHPDGKRAKIYAVNAKTGQVENGIGFYVNGKVVRDGIITIRQWTSIGIGLSNFIDFSTSGGAIRITGPLTINNLSYYNSVNLQQVQTTSARQWLKVKEDGLLQFDWGYWEGQFKWFEVLVLSSTSFYGVDPSGIYKTYVGTARVVLDDKTVLRTGRYKYRMFSDTITNLFTINSV